VLRQLGVFHAAKRIGPILHFRDSSGHDCTCFREETAAQVMRFSVAPGGSDSSFILSEDRLYIARAMNDADDLDAVWKGHVEDDVAANGLQR
jgi:hypothetical protein